MFCGWLFVVFSTDAAGIGNAAMDRPSSRHSVTRRARQEDNDLSPGVSPEVTQRRPADHRGCRGTRRGGRHHRLARATQPGARLRGTAQEHRRRDPRAQLRAEYERERIGLAPVGHRRRSPAVAHAHGVHRRAARHLRRRGQQQAAGAARQHALRPCRGGAPHRVVPAPEACRDDRLRHRTDREIPPHAGDGGLPRGADHGPDGRPDRPHHRLLPRGRRPANDRTSDRARLPPHCLPERLA